MQRDPRSSIILDDLITPPPCVILAAGEGSRMRPLTEFQPKVMLPVGGKPMLERLIVECTKAGITEYILVVGYCEAAVRDYFGDGSDWGIRIRYVHQQKPTGTADALRQTQALLSTSFLLLNGDISLAAPDISPLWRTASNTLSLIELEDVTGMGVAELNSDRVVRIHEKSPNPPTHFANAGAYYFTPEVFPALAMTPCSQRGEFEITDTIQLMIDSGVTVGYRMLSNWRDIGYPWDLLIANEEILAGLQPRVSGVVEEGATIRGSVTLGEGSRIRSGSYIVGPVVIGKHCDIGPNCFIRPATTIGDGCHIGASVEVKNSIIMAGTKIPHLTYIGDSVVGEKCNLGAGTQIANLKLNKTNIRVNGRDTRRRKLGTIIGDGVSIGINSSINPGTIIGAGAIIGPGVVVSGNIAPRSKVYVNNRIVPTTGSSP